MFTAARRQVVANGPSPAPLADIRQRCLRCLSGRSDPIPDACIPLGCGATSLRPLGCQQLILAANLFVIDDQNKFVKRSDEEKKRTLVSGVVKVAESVTKTEDLCRFAPMGLGFAR